MGSDLNQPWVREQYLNEQVRKLEAENAVLRAKVAELNRWVGDLLDSDKMAEADIAALNACIRHLFTEWNALSLAFYVPSGATQEAINRAIGGMKDAFIDYGLAWDNDDCCYRLDRGEP